jgi:chromosome partitioning protein
MKIALISKKGGVGKTTLAVLLHEALKQTGTNVAVRDYDAQGSATKALARINGTREVSGKKYDVLLIDTPPSLTLAATPAAVSVADIILIPTSPSPLDIWEAEETAEFATTKNPRAIVRIVLNKTRTGTLLTTGVKASLGKTKIPVLSMTLGDRQAYQQLLLGGWEMLDTQAAKELLQLTVSITSLRK